MRGQRLAALHQENVSKLIGESYKLNYRIKYWNKINQHKKENIKKPYLTITINQSAKADMIKLKTTRN